MKRILMVGVMILAFAGGAFANSGSTDNSQDEQRRSNTVTEHAKHCSKDMSAITDAGAKQKEVKEGNKSEDKKENNK